VKVGEIPAIFERVKAAGKDGTFASFSFRIADESVKSNVVNVQFSVEDGRVGCDWFLLGPVNLRDKGIFVQAAGRQGRAVSVHKARNGSEFLRVEGEEAVTVCLDMIGKVYGLAETAEVALIWQGFEWP
jgi:hypothetical protein